MIAFDISINGRRLYRAGLGRGGVLTAIIGMYPRTKGAGEKPRLGIQVLSLDVGGMRSGSEANEYLNWPKHTLRVEDQVSVRLIRTGDVDEPARRRRESKEFVERAERRYFDRLKQKHERRRTS
jgi:hypothetical protein